MALVYIQALLLKRYKWLVGWTEFFGRPHSMSTCSANKDLNEMERQRQQKGNMTGMNGRKDGKQLPGHGSRRRWGSCTGNQGWQKAKLPWGPLSNSGQWSWWQAGRSQRSSSLQLCWSSSVALDGWSGVSWSCLWHRLYTKAAGVFPRESSPAAWSARSSPGVWGHSSAAAEKPVPGATTFKLVLSHSLKRSVCGQ